MSLSERDIIITNRLTDWEVEQILYCCEAEEVSGIWLILTKKPLDEGLGKLFAPHKTETGLQIKFYIYLFLECCCAKGFINVTGGTKDSDSVQNKNRICVLWLKLDLLVWVPGVTAIWSSYNK